MMKQTPRIQALKFENLESKQYQELKKLRFNGDKLYLTLLNHPDLHQSRLPLGIYLQQHSSLPEADRELCILRIAFLCQCAYIWGRHINIARHIKLDNRLIHKAGKRHLTAAETHHDWLVEAVDKLYRTDSISSEIWSKLLEKYSNQQMMDLIFTVGGYRMLAMACNSIGIEPEEGDAPLPES